MTTYAVKETFRTLQGEGCNAGRVAVFLRFSRCNLWSGHERDRATAICQFCDTEFVGTDGPGGGLFRRRDALADHVAAMWGPATEHRFVVCTGGEPALQIDDELVAALHARGFEIAIETNGTLPLPAGIDWVCMSPKAGTEIVVTAGDECKVVFPQAGPRTGRLRAARLRSPAAVADGRTRRGGGHGGGGRVLPGPSGVAAERPDPQDARDSLNPGIPMKCYEQVANLSHMSHSGGGPGSESPWRAVMETIVGHHLFSADGVDVGEITDVVGVQGTELVPTWLTVKTGWFGQRLVPCEVVAEREGRFVTRCNAEHVKAAPKVPVHFEPAGKDLDELREHYGLESVEA